MVWRAEDPQGDESGKVKHEIVPYTRGRGLDLGCGPRKAFPHFIGVDSCKDTELFGVPITPDIRVDDCAELSLFGNASMDFVFSSHLLEHIEDHVGALREWMRVLKPGGHLVLYLPHRDLYPNIGDPNGNPDHVHDFVESDIVAAMRETGTAWTLVVQEKRDQDREYSFLMVFRAERMRYLTDESGRENPDPACQRIELKPRPKKSVCVCRFGGFGDMLQACNVFPMLRRQGYHVTVMTTPKGKDVIREDPHVDDWIIQDPDQVPNHELVDYWRAWEKKFDRFVNLSESVEGTLLALPGRTNHAWPAEVRRKRLGVNYLEFTSELAGVPYRSEARFYPTAEEKVYAREYLRDCSAIINKGTPAICVQKRPFTILWALAGSSVHKFYPHQDNVIAAILMHIPEAVVILTGDEACQILEQGWENEPRVRRESGKQSIRQTLALAQAVDVVVGPETGVLNAVAFEPVAKVIMLSHSSHENLSKHWTRTKVLLPKVHCYPCHRLHYGTQFCETNEDTGAAICAQSIPPSEVWAAVKGFHEPEAVDQYVPGGTGRSGAAIPVVA